MASTIGFVGTVEVETRGVRRTWFSLTNDGNGEWVYIGQLDSNDRAAHMAQMTLLMESLRSGCQVKVTHDAAATKFHKSYQGDTFEVTGLRILRAPLRF